MELSKEKLDVQQKNLERLQEAADELLRHMKGHDYSFQRDVTDKKGAYSPEKLHGLVEEMLSLWEAKLRAEPFAAKRRVNAHLRTRRELYGLYLYLVMRCGLCRGGYYYARGGSLKERTDFAFLLEQAKWFIRGWCITNGPDGARQNDLRWGYDEHFGFHLYLPIEDCRRRHGFTDLYVGNLDDELALTPQWKMAGNRPELLADKPEETEQPEAADETEKMEQPEAAEPLDGADGPEEDGALFEDDGDYDYDLLDDAYDPLDELDEETRALFWEGEVERNEELGSRSWDLLLLVQSFEDLDEYCAACERFVELFREAGTEIPRDFCRELEEIVNLYLFQRGIAPLADTDKALEVYGGLCDGPLRQARRYGRGLQWNGL